MLRYLAIIVFYQPVNQVLAQQGGQREAGLSAFAVQYSDELIVSACLFLLLISSYIGVFYQTPVYGGKPMPLWLKAPVCITGGFIAFLFCLHIDKALTLLTPIYVGAMSFISPAIIHLIHAVLIQKFGMRIGVNEELLKEIDAQNTANN
jgi:hypothetical protein